MNLELLGNVFLLALFVGLLGLISTLLFSLADDVARLRGSLKKKLQLLFGEIDTDDPFYALVIESFKKFALQVKNGINDKDDIFIKFVMSVFDKVFGGVGTYKANRAKVEQYLIEFLVKLVDSVYQEVDEVK